MKSLKGWTINGVLISFDQARLIKKLYNTPRDHYYLPIREWLLPFGIAPSRRNGAEKTFRVYFLPDIMCNCKRSSVYEKVVAIASTFRLIVFEYPFWIRNYGALTFLLVNQKRRLLPKDVAKIIVKMVLFSS